MVNAEQNYGVVFADAHLHMTDPRFGGGYDDISNAEMLFSCTSRVEEWKLLKELCKGDGRIVPFYGIHPWFVDECANIDELESILKMDPMANIGEIGLDFRKASLENQITLFTRQLDLAEKYDRIVSIHMVKCEDVMLQILKKYSVKKILHSFTGPESYVKSFIRCGCYFSISPTIFRKSLCKVRSILTLIPENRLLMESDDPNNRCRCLAMLRHTSDIGSVLNITSDKVLKFTMNNAIRLIADFTRS